MISRFCAAAPRAARLATLLLLTACALAPAALAHEGHVHDSDVPTSAAAEPCVDAYVQVAGQGRSCHTDEGLWKVTIPGSEPVLTHGADLVPATVLGQGPAPTPTPTATKSSVSCAPATAQAYRVVYAVPGGATNQSVAKTQMIRERVYQASEFMDAEAKLADPTRSMKLRVRCDANGDVIVEPRQLSGAQATDSFASITAELKAISPLEYNVDSNNVLVFVEGDVGGNIGGQGTFRPDERAGDENSSNNGRSYALVYWVAGDWSWKTTLHEAAHNMGAVQSGAPNSTELGGHCTDGQDIMCYDDGSNTFGPVYSHDVCLDRDHFDCGGDTYFNPLPSGYLAANRNLASPLNTWIKVAGVSDTQAPTMSITSPAPDGYVLNNAITVSASDNIAIDRVEYTIDALAMRADHRPPYTLDTSLVTSDGNHAVAITVHDTAGNAFNYGTFNFKVDRTAPASVTSILNGSVPGSHLNWNGSTSQVSANFAPVATDTNGVIYEYCVTVATNCSVSTIVPFTSAGIVDHGTRFVATATGITLLEDGITNYTFCLRTRDGIGNTNNSMSCGAGQKVDVTPPQAPAVVGDGSTGDTTWIINPALKFAGNWSAVADSGPAQSGFGRYEWCVSRAAHCNGVAGDGTVELGWSTSNGTSGTSTSGAFTNGAITISPEHGVTYYTCARMVDQAKNAGASRCSNGATYDLVAPTQVASVTDGPNPALDVAWLFDQFTLDATWPTTVDGTSGVARYQWCVSQTAPCGAANSGILRAYAATDTGVTVSGGRGSIHFSTFLTEGAIYFVCIKAQDGAGNLTPQTCSNGQTLDTTPPTDPSAVLDGASGSDISQGLPSTLSARWTQPLVAGGGAPFHPEWCVSTSPNCTSGIVRNWGTDGIGSGNDTQGRADLFDLDLASGTYYSCVRMRDDAGRTSPGIACSNGFRVDTIAPVVGTLSSSHDAGWSTSPAVQVNLHNFTDQHSSVSGYSIIVDGFPNSVPIPGVNLTGTTYNAPPRPVGQQTGVYYAHVRAVDAHGNWSGTVHLGPLRVDADKPTGGGVASSTHVTTGAWSRDNTVEIDISPASDSDSGIAGYAVHWDTNAGTLPVNHPTSPVLHRESPALAGGANHWVHIRARDTAGNWSDTVQHLGPFKIDADAPMRGSLIASSHSTGDASSDRTIDLSYVGFHEFGSGLVGLSIVWDQDPNSVGSDTVSPGTASASGTTSSPLLASGTWYAHIRALDLAGNWSATLHSEPYIIDADPPSIGTISSPSHPNGAWNREQTPTLQIDGWNDPDIEYVLVQVTQDPLTQATVTRQNAAPAPHGTPFVLSTLGEAGTWYAHAYAKDHAGNWSATAHSGPIRIDRVVPTGGAATSTSHTGDWSTDTTVDIKVTTPATDAHSQLDGYSVVFSQATFEHGRGPKVLEEGDTTFTSGELGPGTWWAHVRAIDHAGNSGSEFLVGPFRIDAVAPFAGITDTNTAPHGAAYTMGTTITARLGSWFDDHSSIAGYAVSWDDNPTAEAPFTLSGPATQLSYSSPPRSDGTWYFHVRARDVAGNWSITRHSGPLRVDATAPAAGTVSSSSHGGAAWSTDPTVDLQVPGFSDGLSGLAHYGVQWSQDAAVPAGAQDLIPATLAEAGAGRPLGSGTWYAHVQVLDGAGNRSAMVVAGPFRIDVDAPTLPLGSSLSHGSGAFLADDSIDFTVDTPADDAGSLLDGYSVEWSNFADTLPNDTKDEEESLTDLTRIGATSGSWYLHLRPVDNAGNWSATASHFGPFKVDLAAPTVGTVTGASHAAPWTNDATIEVDLAGFSDGAGSGINGYSIVWNQSAVAAGTTTVGAGPNAARVTSPELASGRWYAHVRTVDGVGHWSDATAHAGPFGIDRTAPTVGTLASSSHTAASSQDQTIELQAAGFDDGHSGVVGYAVTWDRAPIKAFDPAAAVTSAGSAFTSPTLDSGTWYAHVQAVDGSGHRSTVVDAGPFTIAAAVVAPPPPPPPPPATPPPPPASPPASPTPPPADTPASDDTGTPDPDSFGGTGLDDVFNGMDGNDKFAGLGGNDTFNGGPGNDTANGGPGKDKLSGDAGNDKLVGGPDIDVLKGGAGDDTLDANDKKPGDTVDCGPGKKDKAIVNKGDKVKGCEKVTRK